MKWKGRRQSDNVEDRRGMSSGGKTLRWRNCGAYNIIDKCFGGENVQMLTPLLEQINRGESTTIEQRDLTAKELEEQAFIRTIVADNEDVWTTISRKTI
jgi:predicted metalloprotease